jgi:predicted RNase H-like nuclease (RuvC/YqgF family)
VYRRIQATEKAYEVDEKIEKATAGNRQLNKLIRERGKEIEQLQKELTNTRIVER